VPERDNLVNFVNAMDTYNGRKVWVHCATNMRVAAFVGLYRVLRQKWDRQRAFELMNSVWEPDEVWSAFIEESLRGNT
jgi:hypothetical protein